MWRSLATSTSPQRLFASIQKKQIASSFRFSSSSNASSAPLFHEWAYRDEVYSSENPPPDNVFATSSGLVLFLHGLLGNGKNLRTMIKRTMANNPHLVGLTMDLRGHGMSPSYNPPHVFEACAMDVRTTLEQLHAKHHYSPPPPLVSIVGHSWGGRIALQLAYDLSQQQQQPRTWLLDVVPGVAHSSIHHVLEAIDAVPSTTDKKLILKTLLDQDLDISIAQWLVASMRMKENALDWGFDKHVVNEVLPQFATHDFYGILSALTENGRVDLVRSGQNEAWSHSNALERLREAGGPGFHMHLLPNAGHWVHVDDLEGLLDVFEEEELD